MFELQNQNICVAIYTLHIHTKKHETVMEFCILEI